MAPIARADTARTEASDTSPPVTGSDGRGLGVVASAGAGASRVSPVRTVSPTRMGQHPHTLPGIVIPAGRRGNTVIPLEPPDEHVPPRPFGGQIHRSAMRVQRPGADFERAVHRGNLPGGQQPVVVVFRGNLSPDGLYASSLEGLSGSPDHHTLTVAYGRSAANSYSSLPAYWP